MAKFKLKGRYTLECRGPDGSLRWSEDIDNLVTNAGLNHILDAALGGGTPTTTWYLGLTDSTPTVAGADTMASHAGWAEVTAYSQSTRVACSFGAVASQAIGNSASPAAFTINGSVTVGGAFLVSNSTKGGTTGTLLSVGALTGGDRAVVADETVSVTYTLSAADA